MADHNQNFNMNEYHNPYNPNRNKQKKPRNIFATAALIFGIVASINLCCCAFATAITMGVGAVSFAFISKKDQTMSVPARIAVFLGIGAVVFGVAEYFFLLHVMELIKTPENITYFNQLLEEAEKMMESQAALKEVMKNGL